MLEKINIGKCCQTHFQCLKINEQFVKEIKHLLVKLDSTQYHNFNGDNKHYE